MNISNSTFAPRRCFTRVFFLAFVAASLAGCCNGIGGGGNSGGCTPDQHPDDLKANKPPAITAVTSPAHVAELVAVEITATAEDEDGDPLTYSWRQKSGPIAGGLFKTTDGNRTLFNAPKVSGSERFVYSVTVNDGTDSVSRDIEITVSEASGMAVLANTSELAGTPFFYHENLSAPVALGVAGMSPAVDIEISPDHKYLLYREGGGQRRLYTVHLGTFYARHVGNVETFAVSPGSRYLAYTQGDKLHIEELAGSSTHHIFEIGLDQTSTVETMSWAANGKALAFFKRAPLEEKGLYVVSLDEFEQDYTPRRVSPIARDLDNDGVKDSRLLDYAWSPNTGQIAIMGEFTRSGVRELWIAAGLAKAPLDNAVDITGPLEVPASCTCDALSPFNDLSFAWSPDGKKIAFVTEAQGDDVRNLFVVETVTTQTFQRLDISGPATDTDGDGNLDSTASSNFTWSPTSGHIAFLSDRNTAGVQELYVARLHDNGTLDAIEKVSGEITAADGDSLNGNIDGDVLPAFSWSPAGREIAFAGDLMQDAVTELFVVNMSNASSRRKLSGPNRASDGDASNGDPDGDVLMWLWSPDSQKLLFTGDLETDRVVDVHLVDTVGATPARLTGTTVAPETTDHPVMDIGIFSKSGLRWSPDSQTAAFLANYTEQGRADLFVVPLGSDGEAGNRNTVMQDVASFRWFGPDR